MVARNEVAFQAKMALSASILDYANQSHRRIALTVGFGLIALVVILAVDLLFHLAYWTSFWERIVCDILEAALLALVALRIFRFRERLKQRREREMGYLNHHVRNSLTLITMAELALADHKERISLVKKASQRICSVLEQLTDGENVAIDHEDPAKIERQAKQKTDVEENRDFQI